MATLAIGYECVLAILLSAPTIFLDADWKAGGIPAGAIKFASEVVPRPGDHIPVEPPEIASFETRTGM